MHKQWSGADFPHPDLVLDVLGSVGVHESVQGLHEVSVAGTDTGYHQSTTERRGDSQIV